MFDQKKKTCLSLTDYAKMELTERANKKGLKLSTYLEYLARTPEKGERN